jgi:hypothetical protein
VGIFSLAVSGLLISDLGEGTVLVIIFFGDNDRLSAGQVVLIQINRRGLETKRGFGDQTGVWRPNPYAGVWRPNPRVMRTQDIGGLTHIFFPFRFRVASPRSRKFRIH